MGFKPNEKLFTPQQLIEKWHEYRAQCDTATITKTCVDPKTHEVYTVDIAAPTTYSIIGFCTFLKLTRSCFYTTYKNAQGEHAEEYRELCEGIAQECELSARSGFEQGTLHPGLAKLWMGKYDDYKEVIQSESPGQVIIQPQYGLPEPLKQIEDKKEPEE